MNFYKILFIVSLALFSCSSDKEEAAKTVATWKVYDLQQGLKAAFPSRPTPKTVGHSPDITSYEHLVEHKDVTYSVNIITNKKLSDAAAWQQFLKEEVLAFKSEERRDIKLKGRDAVFSKVRVNNLYGYTINMVVDNKCVLNIAIRRKGEYPKEAFLMSFAEKVQF